MDSHSDSVEEEDTVAEAAASEKKAADTSETGSKVAVAAAPEE